MSAMHKIMPVAAILALAGLAGCGGNEPAEAPGETAAPSDAPLAPAEAVTTAAATATATATATPTPSATASAAAAAKPEPKAASVTPVAAPAGPPAGFAQCGVCHSVQPGKHGIGPRLAGVYGTKAGAIAGYNFSPALKASGLTWNDATLDKWLAAPMTTVPGTKMAYPGLKDAAQRKAVIAYMKTL